MQRIICYKQCLHTQKLMIKNPYKPSHNDIIRILVVYQVFVNFGNIFQLGDCLIRLSNHKMCHVLQNVPDNVTSHRLPCGWYMRVAYIIDCAGLTGDNATCHVKS